MVEGPKATITTASDNNITTIYTQCTQGPHGPGPYQPIEGYVKQVGGHCELRCEQLEDYGKISFVRQYIGFGEENIGSATSCDYIKWSTVPMAGSCTITPVAVCCKPSSSYEDESEYGSGEGSDSGKDEYGSGDGYGAGKDSGDGGYGGKGKDSGDAYYGSDDRDYKGGRDGGYSDDYAYLKAKAAKANTKVAKAKSVKAKASAKAPTPAPKFAWVG
jgi:hypothetical protein